MKKHIEILIPYLERPKPPTELTPPEIIPHLKACVQAKAEDPESDRFETVLEWCRRKLTEAA